MGGYLLLAVGLINLRYQTGQSEVLRHSLLIIAPGILLLAATWISGIVQHLSRKSVQLSIGTVGILLVLYSVLN